MSATTALFLPQMDTCTYSGTSAHACPTCTKRTKQACIARLTDSHSESTPSSACPPTPACESQGCGCARLRKACRCQHTHGVTAVPDVWHLQGQPLAAARDCTVSQLQQLLTTCLQAFHTACMTGGHLASHCLLRILLLHTTHSLSCPAPMKRHLQGSPLLATQPAAKACLPRPRRPAGRLPCLRLLRCWRPSWRAPGTSPAAP